MKDEISSNSYSKTFIIKGEKCRVTANCSCMFWENEETRNHPTIVTLNELISLRACFCEKRNGKLLCDCILDENNGSSVTSTSSNSSTRSPSSHTNNKLKRICVYYAIPSGKLGWKVNLLILQVTSDTTDEISAVNDWLIKTRSLLEELKRPKKILVFVNPFGGRRKAPSIYTKNVLPILQLAGCEAECILTQRANHARDMLENVDVPIKEFDAIVCVGGDGMFAELLNGIINRTQLEANQNTSIENLPERPTITIGVIPAGSTDAVAFSTCGDNSPETSTIHIILGNKVNIDVCALHSVKDEGKLLRYATSFLGYGYFGDTLKASEKNRWMGPRRYDYAGFKKIMAHKLYSGELRMHVSTIDGSPKDSDICTTNCPLCAKAFSRTKHAKEIMSRPTVEDEGTACIRIRGRFLGINAATMSCRCGMSKNGISPAAHLGNGCTDLIVVTKCSRANYLRYMMRIGFLPDSPFDLNFVDVYRVREFEFTPIVNPGDAKQSYQLSDASVWNCDGEIINEAAIHVKVHCQLVTVFGNGRENRNLDKTTTNRRVKDANASEADLKKKEQNCLSNRAEIYAKH